MSVPFDDLAKTPDDTNQPMSDTALCHFSSVKDANENVVKSKSIHEEILEPKSEKTYRYDFLVWNHECNNEEASRINEEMEKKGLRGYIYDRDKIAGQYKLTAVEQAMQSTKSIILLISTEAITCGEFSDKMHASSNYNVIPIYKGLPKSRYPGHLRHHVDIRYENNPDFWIRLHTAITRPKRGVGSSLALGNLSKPIKKEPESQASPLQRKSSRPIKMVPGKSPAPEKQYKKSPPSSQQKPEKKGLFSLFRSKQNGEKEMPAIPMKTFRIKREVLDVEKSTGNVM